MGKDKRAVNNFKVGVFGTKGKVGSTIYEAVEIADDLELAVGLDSGDDLSELVTAGARTIVDFTQPDSAMDNLEFCIRNDINTIVGTTGFTKERLDQVQHWLDNADGDASTLTMPNFMIFVVLTMKVAELVVPYFDSAEVIEMHHPFRKDVPPGTAIHIAEAIAHTHKKVDMGEQPDATEQTLDGTRGAEVKDIPTHIIRTTSSMAHETAIFSAEGQSLTIKQDFHSRTSFVPDVLLGVRKIKDFPGLTVRPEPLLGL